MELKKILYDSDNELYLIYGDNYTYYNGKKLEISYGSPFQVTKYSPVTLESRKKVTTMSHYENIKTKEVVTKEEYDSVYNLKINKYDDDDEEDSFNSIEDELKYKYFMKDIKAVYKEEETITTYEFEVVNKPISAYSNIQMLSSMDDIEKVSQGICKYFSTPIKWAFDYFEEKQEECDTNYSIKNSTHSGIEYLQIEDNYVFTGNNKLTYLDNSYCTYKQAIEFMEKDKLKIKNGIDLAFKKLNKDKLSDIEKGEYISTLQRILNNVRDLKVIKTSYTDKSILINFLTDKLK